MLGKHESREQQRQGYKRGLRRVAWAWGNPLIFLLLYSSIVDFTFPCCFRPLMFALFTIVYYMAPSFRQQPQKEHGPSYLLHIYRKSSRQHFSQICRFFSHVSRHPRLDPLLAEMFQYSPREDHLTVVTYNPKNFNHHCLLLHHISYLPYLPLIYFPFI